MADFAHHIPAGQSVTPGHLPWPRIVVLSGDATLEAWVKAAFGRGHVVTVVRTVAGLTGAARAAPGPTVVLTTLRDGDGISVATQIRCLKARAPQVAVLVYCRPNADLAEEIRDVARAGADELLFDDFDDRPRLLRAFVAKATLNAGAQWIRRRVLRGLPASLRDMFDFALLYPREARYVAAVAAALGVHRKTLVDRCARAGAPPPGTVIQWARLLIAAWSIRSCAGSVELTAHELEFSSATALRNMLKRYSGLKPSDLRKPDGLEALLAIATQALRKRDTPDEPESVIRL